MIEPVSNPGRVLIVEDEPDLAALISRHLSAIPLSVEWASDGESGLRRALAEQWDALVLDVRLPRRDGLEVCREVRARNRAIPILMLTALGSEIDRVLGLEMGADDYLTKPFSVVELQARVRALLRRGRLVRQEDNPGAVDEAGLSLTDKRSEVVRVGELCIDKGRHRVWFHSNEMNLTRREFDLLWHFSRHPGQVFSRGELLASVWGQGHDGYDHTVNSHINRLRGKLRQQPSCMVNIETVWGVGYRLDVQS